ncbi:MAG: DUF3048 C-terminal domain-containing protein, partial [Chloroflexi bacterium]|nr:DUF3048 C-terminal domain-containing protein [Chloroflexota bacterium]
TGVGKAIYFQEGLATEGAWLRPSLGNPTQRLDPTAQPIALRPGPIWVQVVPVGPLEGAVSVRGRDASVRALDLQRSSFPTICTQCRGRAGVR